MSSLVLKDTGNILFQYMAKVNRIPILTESEENHHYQEMANGNLLSAKILVASHLRLVVKIANSYKNYGLPMMDLISEGNIGLMRAVKTFDYKKGYKLATYSRWWIKAYIQEYILKMWSIVKIGTSAVQKKLFFNLKKVKNHIFNYGEPKHLSNDDVNKISNFLNVENNDVLEMNARITKNDIYLNSHLNSEEETERLDLISSRQPLQDVIVDNKREKSKRSKLLAAAVNTLDEREKEVLRLRKLTDEPLTLNEVSKLCGISGERVRQVEAKAIEKIKDFVVKNSKNII